MQSSAVTFGRGSIRMRIKKKTGSNAGLTSQKVQPLKGWLKKRNNNGDMGGIKENCSNT